MTHFWTSAIIKNDVDDSGETKNLFRWIKRKWDFCELKMNRWNLREGKWWPLQSMKKWWLNYHENTK